jgi:lysophospholipase L1-like esterase
MSLDKLNQIKLRIGPSSEYIVKDAELTWSETDQNFIILADAIKDLSGNNIGGIDEYNPAVSYSNTDPDTYVSYNGNTYKYIGSSSSTGVTPGTDETKWELVSAGEFSHRQNTDTKLAEGTENEVSASELKTLIGEGGNFDPDADYTFGGNNEFSNPVVVADATEDNEAPNLGQVNALIEEIDLSGKQSTSEKNQANGYAGLDSSGKVASAQLPSYVDDVIEVANFAALPVTGEAGKIYITLDNNKVYRWSGSAYVEIVASPGSTDAVPEGTTNKYFTETRVRDAKLTGFVAGSNSPITGSNTVLQALQNTQGQLSALFGTVSITALQAETVAYYNDLVSRSGIMEYEVLLAIDRLVANGKLNGWWNKIVELYPFAGGNLAAALTKLKTAAGLNSYLTTNGTWTETDYSLIKGIGYTGTVVSGKYLSTGLIVENHSITTADMSILAYRTNNAAPTGGISGWAHGTNNSGGTNILIGDIGTGLFASGLQPYSTRRGRGVKLCSIVGTNAKTWFGQVLSQDRSFTNPATPLSSEFTLYRCSTGTPAYASDLLGFIAVGKGMTTAEGNAFTKAVEDFIYDIGRDNILGGRRICLGDSNTSGQANATAKARFSSVICRRKGVTEYNIGAPSSQLRQTAVNVIGGYQKLSQVLTIPASEFQICYGTNDMITGDVSADGNSTIIADFKAKYKEILQAAIDNGWLTLVLGIPYCDPSLANATKQAAYRDAQAQAAIEVGVPFVDLYQAMIDTGNPASLMAETLHLNDAGCKFAGDLVILRENGIIQRTLTLDFPSIATGASADLTLTIYEAVPGLGCSVTPKSDLGVDVTLSAFVSSANTVTVRATNRTSETVDLTSQFFTVSVIKPE